MAVRAGEGLGAVRRPEASDTDLVYDVAHPWSADQREACQRGRARAEAHAGAQPRVASSAAPITITISSGASARASAASANSTPTTAHRESRRAFAGPQRREQRGRHEWYGNRLRHQRTVGCDEERPYRSKRAATMPTRAPARRLPTRATSGTVAAPTMLDRHVPGTPTEVRHAAARRGTAGTAADSSPSARSGARRRSGRRYSRARASGPAIR